MDGIFGALRAFLLADAAIAGLVVARVYPIRAPQKAVYPLITMQKIVEQGFGHLRGGKGRGLVAPRYQIDAWTSEVGGNASFLRGQELGHAIRERLDGYTGILTDTNASPEESYQVSILFDDARDLFETDAAGGGYYRQSTDYVIWHQPVTV